MAGEAGQEEKSTNMVSSSSGGFYYSDIASNNPNIQTHLVNQIQSFDSNPEIFNLTTGMEMIGFPHKNLSDHNNTAAIWKGFSFGSNKNGNNPVVVGPSSSKTMNMNESTTSDFYPHDHHHQQFNITKPADFTTTAISDTTRSDHQNLMAVAPTHHHDHDQSAASWQDDNNNRRSLLVDDSSLRCVFSCEGNERPSQGLSLSLSSNNPSSIGLQSFELRHTHQDHHHQQGDLRYLSSSSRDGFIGKSLMQDGFLGKAENNYQHHHHQQQEEESHHQFQLRNSKFLGPAQELLNEFCSIGTKQTDTPKQKSLKINRWEEEQHENTSSSSSRKQNLSSLELIELQKRKAKLLSMLEEVDRRYKHYCDQMKAVVSSFEAVAGNGAARVYSALASNAMSKHFRCLRDGIVGQIQATKKAMGENDPIAPGTTRGETPRLRLLDQTLRQQRVLQQMSMMEAHPWRPQRGLPERSVSVLRAWLFEHFLHPYPSDVDKHILARQTGLSRSQVSNWFINARVRLWKPMVEEMYLEETKEQDNLASSDGAAAIDDCRPNQNPSTDQKPTPDQLVRIDSECLSSIITTNPDKNEGKSGKTIQNNNHHLHHHQNFGRVAADTYGAMGLDHFSSYNHHAVAAAANAVTYTTTSESGHQNFGGGGGGSGGGVSLTLGLQQHGGSGVSLAFSPASHNSLFYPRDHIDDCQPVQYSILDGEGQNLPYRNLLGAQLLHDLAG